MTRHPTHMLAAGRVTMNVLRVLGLGLLPPDAALLTGRETLTFVLENCWASITYRDFRRGSEYSAFHRKWFAGSLAVGTDRLIAYWGSKRIINVPFSDPRFSELDLSASTDRMVDIRHDAALFHPTWSGRIQYRYSTRDAKAIVAEINRQSALQNFSPAGV